MGGQAGAAQLPMNADEERPSRPEDRMTLRSQDDEHFERFRMERKRAQPRPNPSAAPDFDNGALRELQQVEQRELRDQKLTREVHDFFAEATAQAKSIVERVSRDAESEATQRVEKDMEAFLIDALARMNTFVVKMMREKNSQVAETQVEPSVGNIVGRLLDEFRFAGTAAVGDKHLGQDPFQTDIEAVQREFKSRIGNIRQDDGQSVVPIDRRAVAMIELEEDEDTVADEEAPPQSAPLPVPRATAVAPVVPANAPSAEPPAEVQEMERFRAALKSLVRQGQMTREEALAAWKVKIDARSGR